MGAGPTTLSPAELEFDPEPVAVERAGRGWRRPSLRATEGFLVFALFTAAYFVIGYKVVVELHVVNFDSLSRLAHAYFVWFNDPAKLAAIGFVWPPVQTMIYLPFALIAPLATSLAALPAASATFMAATMVMINLAFRTCEMPWYARWPLLLAFGLNPMIVYYGANGMAEAVYLFFLSFGVYFLIRWRQTHANHLLAFVGAGIAFSALSRYEIMPFAIVIAAGITLVILTTWERPERARSLESALVLYAAPVVYFGVAWLFFNWLILGNPLYFLTFGATTADISTSAGATSDLPGQDLGLIGTVLYLVRLNYALLPLTLAALAALLLTAVVKRNPMSLVLAAVLCTNAAVTALLFMKSPDSNLLQLRYNMRAMPIAILAVAWLYYVWRPRPLRFVIWAATLAMLVGGMAVTWRTMESYGYQYEENVFLRALTTGEDQEGNVGLSGYPIGIASEQDMADYIEGNVAEDDTILTDDAQTLGVMLLTGDPARFFDRIDRGDTRWFAARDDPWGRVQYLLVSKNERCRLPCIDLVRDRYPDILQDLEPGMHIVYQTHRYALVQLNEEEPGSKRPLDGAQSQAGQRP